MARQRQTHGRTAYIQRWCRCDEICRAAVREYSDQRRREAGVKQSAARPWTVQDLVVLLEPISAAEAAQRLDRTVAAVSRKRCELRAVGPVGTNSRPRVAGAS